MSFGARSLAALAAGTALTALACPAAVVARVAAAGSDIRLASPGARTDRPAHAASAGRAADTTQPASPPSPGSRAARRIGGPLMASRGVVVNEPAGARPLPQIPSSAWVIANANTGQVLAARDPHGEFGPASTLKVLTAVTL